MHFRWMQLLPKSIVLTCVPGVSPPALTARVDDAADPPVHLAWVRLPKSCALPSVDIL